MSEWKKGDLCPTCSGADFWYYPPNAWITAGGYDRDGSHWHMDVPYEIDQEVYVCKCCGWASVNISDFAKGIMFHSDSTPAYTSEDPRVEAALSADEAYQKLVSAEKEVQEWMDAKYKELEHLSFFEIGNLASVTEKRRQLREIRHELGWLRYRIKVQSSTSKAKKVNE